jgi:hypothetical protein
MLIYDGDWGCCRGQLEFGDDKAEDEDDESRTRGKMGKSRRYKMKNAEMWVMKRKRKDTVDPRHLPLTHLSSTSRTASLLVFPYGT